MPFVTLINAREIDRLLPMGACIEVMARAARDLEGSLALPCEPERGAIDLSVGPLMGFVVVVESFFLTSTGGVGAVNGKRLSSCEQNKAKASKSDPVETEGKP